MSIYTESGIQINLSNHPHLRLKDCPAYADLSVFYFKEVDFIWWNQSENCLYLSDFKDFTNAQSAQKIEKVIPNLIEKSVHVLSILSSIWLKTKGSGEFVEFFNKHLQQNALGKTPIKIVHIINCPSIFEMHFAAINAAFMQRFGAFSKLFDIETALVLPIGKARQFMDVFQ